MPHEFLTFKKLWAEVEVATRSEHLEALINGDEAVIAANVEARRDARNSYAGRAEELFRTDALSAAWEGSSCRYYIARAVAMDISLAAGL